ncbi:transposable element Tc1 transposase [Trichonephila clavipes]|nr:transposable element Tc1 transposase [Trichonephila clavipes]
MKTSGWSTRRVAGQVDRSECAVRNCWEQWTREGTHAWKTGSGATGRPRGEKIEGSDESRFVLGTDDNHVLVWRSPGERYNSPHTVLHHTARTAGVMVWGTIAYDSQSTLIVMRGTLTGQRYVDDIL